MEYCFTCRIGQIDWRTEDITLNEGTVVWMGHVGRCSRSECGDSFYSFPRFEQLMRTIADARLKVGDDELAAIYSEVEHRWTLVRPRLR